MNDCILLDAGSGGAASQRLIGEVFARSFDNEILATMDDAALLTPPPGQLAMSVDSYTVSPLFFPGGSIGSLAVNGTVNDISMLAARPLWLTAAFIIEEGLPVATLQAIVSDMALACRKADVLIVTGDTKVTPKGTCDGIFITTSGLGQVLLSPAPSGASARPGDAVIVSGAVGDHGLAVLAAREDLSFLSDAVSDCAPLNGLVETLTKSVPAIHVLRDPTRGGLATTLNEIAGQSGVCIEIDEQSIPVNPSAGEGCALLGLDPLYLANEGKCICILPEKYAEAALEAMRSCEYGKDARIIGRVTDRKKGRVILHTRMGGERFLGMLEGAPLPRIC